jgi:predicted ATP-grasp superfamily ATP-dependent carboligase
MRDPITPTSGCDSASSTKLCASAYWQREASGRSLGCLLLAQGQTLRLIGVHDQLIDPTDDEPFRFAGVVGPTRLSDAQMTTLLAALHRLVTAFALRGLVSVDWLIDGDRWLLLEVNPRPSASLAVHERLLARTSARSLLAEHVAQFLPDELPSGLGIAEAALANLQADARSAHPDRCGGERIVYAPTPLRVEAAMLERWAAAAELHDIPAAPVDLPAGAPVLSVSAFGPHMAAVKQALEQRCDNVLRELLPGGSASRPDAAAAPAMSPTSSCGALAAEAI